MKCKHEFNGIGGCKENPGIFGIGGAALLKVEKCKKCGIERRMVFGDVDHPTRNHGWKYDYYKGEEGR